MTPEAQRIKIAEACGWKITTHKTHPSFKSVIKGITLENYSEEEYLPNYPEDLNACHEMEKVLTPEQEEDYVHELSGLIMTTAYEDDPRYLKSNLSSFDSSYRATAPQRCEAFLRTIGEFEE